MKVYILIQKSIRQVLTGISFVIFSSGSVYFAFFVIPLVMLFTTNQSKRQSYIKHLLSYHLKLYIFILKIFGLMKLSVKDIKDIKCDKGVVIIANHPTLIDVLVILALIPDADCVISSRFARHPILKYVVKSTGFITNASAVCFIKQCASRLKQKRNIVIFPEGTRTQPGRYPCFRRGVAHVAWLSGRPVRPLYITCKPTTLFKYDKWYNVPMRMPDFSIAIGDLIPPPSKKEQVSSKYCIQQFTRKLECHYHEILSDL